MGAAAGFAGLVAVTSLRGTPVSAPASKATKELMKNLDPKFLVTVSAVGKSKTGITNDGADFGPDTPGTSTNGIQEALNSIAATGGTVYCVNNGTYNIAATVFGTGDNQTLFFEAGCVLSLDTSGDFSTSVFFPFTDGSSHNFNNVRWVGNGTTIATNGLSSCYAIIELLNLAYSTAGSCTSGGLVEGFLLTEVAVVGLVLVCANSPGTVPAFDECVRDVVLRSVTIQYASSVSGSPAGLYIAGSAWQVLVEQCVVDQSESDISGADACFVRSQYGNVRNVVFRECAFITNEDGGNSPIEIQGADNASGCTTQFITLEDCELVNGYSFVDDDWTTGTYYYAYVNEIEFRRCRFESSMMLFQSCPNSNGALAYGWPLGYVRFVDCDLDGQSWSSFVSSTVVNRSPGQSVDVSSLFSSSGTSYTNGQLATDLNGDTVAFDQTLFVAGGSGVSVEVNGQGSSTGGPSSGLFVLRAGDSVTVSYSSPPKVYLSPL